jgi:hypoxanthine phosphoribosyltransferase
MSEATTPDPALPAQPKTLIPKETVQGVVRLMAHVISRELQGGEITVIPVFTGALFFAVDLLRGLEGIDPRVEGVHVKSYTHRSAGDLTLKQLPQPESIKGRDLLIVDDIIDTGQTLHRVIEAMRPFQPRSIRCAVLLRKRGRQDPQFNVRVDYVGFEILDYFVVGYGMDDHARHRNLSYIGYFPDERPDQGTRFSQIICE